MILDRLEQIHLYRGLSVHMDRAIDYLTRTDLSSLPDGRHEIDGEPVFMNIMPVSLGDNPNWEAHRRYIDIQIALMEGESIAWAPLESIQGFSPYDESKGDIQLSQDASQGLVFPLHKGSFGIYFPSDAHRPGLGQGQSRKAVVKVQVA